MGVRTTENLLKKIAIAYADEKVGSDVLYRAAAAYVKAKTKARNCRDKWKLKKRMGQ